MGCRNVGVCGSSLDDLPNTPPFANTWIKVRYLNKALVSNKGVSSVQAILKDLLRLDSAR